MHSWDPAHYQEFLGERLRAGRDLISRIDVLAPERVVDLGCGTGRLTAELAARWPTAGVLGIDRSAEMLTAASGAGIEYELADIETWEPDQPVGLLFSNAGLHWIPDHETLFPHLVGMLAPGGVLAAQMPISWDQPSHRVMRDVGADFGVEIQSPPTLEPVAYYNILSGRAVETEVWITTYYHLLDGDNPVFRWVSATGVKRFLDRIRPEHHANYLKECARRMAAAYPANRRGKTVFPFTRLFLLARA